MVDITEAIINIDLAGKIYDKLKEKDSGKFFYRDHVVRFEIDLRDRENQPATANIEVLDQEGYRVEMYKLNFTNPDGISIRVE